MVRIDTRGSKQGGLIKVMESKSKGHVDGYTDKKRRTMLKRYLAWLKGQHNTLIK